jgi:acetyl esterase/lipase
MVRGRYSLGSQLHIYICTVHYLSLAHPFISVPTHISQVGAAAYRQLRWEGKTPLPKPIVLENGVNGSLPSRDNGRAIPYRMFKPEGESRGILMHIHGGGWVLQSEA